MGVDGLLHLRSQTLAGVHHEEECGVSTSLSLRVFNVLCASLVIAKSSHVFEMLALSLL